MQDNSLKKDIGTIGVLVVFLIFAVCILFVIISGASVYKKLSDKNDFAYQKRTISRYLFTKIYDADSFDSISVIPFENENALSIKDTIGEDEYYTLIYTKNGYLMELFTPNDYVSDAASGEKVIECDNISFDIESSLITARFSIDSGESNTIYLTAMEGYIDE